MAYMKRIEFPLEQDTTQQLSLQQRRTVSPETGVQSKPLIS